MTDAFVFKGGTFLKHAHGLDRFSEDLDFTRFSGTAGTDHLAAAADSLDRYGLSAEIDDVEKQANAILARLRYEGPLFDGTDRSRGHVEIDVSTRTDVFRDPEWCRLFVPYPETRAVTARSLVIEEAFAEKLRALATRSQGRDLYDCWFLLEQAVPIEPELFERKMNVLGKSARVTASIDESEWNRDLSVLVKHPPEYETAVKTVTEALDDAGVPVQVGTD